MPEYPSCGSHTLYSHTLYSYTHYSYTHYSYTLYSYTHYSYTHYNYTVHINTTAVTYYLYKQDVNVLNPLMGHFLQGKHKI